MSSTNAGKRIFITGGASGLGRALAEIAARDGWRVCVGDIHDARLAETLARLRELGAAQANEHRAVKCDVRKLEDVEHVARTLGEAWGGVDVVVNNAGVAIGGPIDEVPYADFARVVDINLMGVVRGCTVFAPILKRQGSGHIVNVASLAGLVHLPMMTAYNTTKAAVVALSETLRIELAPHNVDVTVVCPSFFRTNLQESLPPGDGMSDRMSRKLLTEAKHDAQEIARRVWRDVRRKRTHSLPHVEGRAFWALKRLAPGVFARIIIAGAARLEKKQREAAERRAARAAAAPTTTGDAQGARDDEKRAA